MRKQWSGLVLSVIAACGVTAAAETAPEQSDAQWKQQMEQKIDALTREIENNKLGEAASRGETRYESKHGFAPAAAKVYHIQKGISFGGYGEMVYKDPDNQRDNGTASGSKREVDFLRAILYTGYKFNDKILFNSELEFEHASTTSGGERGEVSVELAYLDFLLSKPAGIRTGLLLVPMGFTNELHEPTVFHGALRPSVEQNIIPTTWRENGVGVFGELGGFSYRSYLMAGLQATMDTGVSGFSASSGLRGGRSKGAKSKAEDLGWVGRVDYTAIPGVLLGGSFYTGQSGQNATTTSGQEIDAPVTLWELHASAEFKGLELRGLYTKGTIGEVSLINSKNGYTGSNSVGERLFGGYAQAAYNVLSHVNTNQYLAPFVRYERYDTQQRVPAGFTKNAANSRTEFTYGLTYKPIPQVVIKGDWQDYDNQAGTGVDQFNLGFGYIF